jgi:protein gp37
MLKSRIEWTDYTLNPIKGLCPVDCKDTQGKSYCYARRMYKRFKWDTEIRYEPNEFNGLPSKPSRIFVGSTMELFGDWINRDWMHMTFAKILARPQHTFIFLTKQPQNLPKRFPDNCWVGVSATNQEQYYDGVSNIAGIEAKIKFVSFEPLLEQINGGGCNEEYRLDSIEEFDWVIIGQQTPVSARTQPRIEWIYEIMQAANRSRIPVFLKDNLLTLLPSREP